HDVREKLVRSSATPGCLIPSVMGFVEQGQGHLPTARVLGRVMCSPMAHAEFDASRP
ncbi:hypothetical protein ACUXQ2_006405, partial [Cupriavidus metallidurans]